MICVVLSKTTNISSKDFSAPPPTRHAKRLSFAGQRMFLLVIAQSSIFSTDLFLSLADFCWIMLPWWEHIGYADAVRGQSEKVRHAYHNARACAVTIFPPAGPFRLAISYKFAKF